MARFDWAKVNTVGPIFDLDKLNWLNGHYIRTLSSDGLANRIEHLQYTGEWPTPDATAVDILRRATPLIQERLVTLSEAPGKLAYLFASDDEIEIAEDARAQLNDQAAQTLDAAAAALEALPEWNAEAIQAALRAALVDGLGIKPRFAFGAARIALTGQRVSPPLFESIEILGRESTLSIRRLRQTL